MGGQVNVSVDASPAPDLNQVMTEIRDHYEGAINKNRKELEAWYQNKVRSQSGSEYSHFDSLVLIYLVSMPLILYDCWVKKQTNVLFLICSDRSGGAGCGDTDRDSGDDPHRD